jgi:indolepyruvate ferredoxin oxidoreductase beta subunit
MSIAPSKTKSILIAALGGEGGGVLSDWTLATIRAAGYLAQGTSIPGVAQRTGATTYYIEYSSIPLAELGERKPVFALTPVPGQVDAMIASELIEAARAAQIGYVSPNRTTLIASAHRVFATSEKIAMSDGRFDSEAALRAVHALAQRAIIFDMEKAAELAGTVINAVLFGALAGSRVLGIDRQYFENAIKSSGKSVDASMRGFELGFSAACGDVPEVSTQAKEPTQNTQLLFPEFPVETQFIIENGFRRCLDYQNRAYADDYLAKIRDLTALDRSLGGASNGWKLTIEGARFLALRMTYEDVIRVADLKTRRDRFATVRNETKAKSGEPIRITEFLKPGPEEVCALLSPRLGDLFLNFLKKRNLEHRFNIGLYIKSHTITGFLIMRALANMRFLRLKSWRYAEELKLTSRWWEAVKSAASIDYRFGVETAECADLVKGYSGTYRRGIRNFNIIFDRVVEPAIAQFKGAADLVRGARLAALSDPEGSALDTYLETHTEQTDRGAIKAYA